MKDGQEYNYETAGFNGFLRRTIASNVTERSLKNVGVARTHQPQQINFDQTQVGGTIGDTLQVGKRAFVDGAAGRFGTKDEEGNIVAAFGDVEF